MNYITTPIYYVNDAPHIGHIYTSIIADFLARSFRFTEESFFLTGTDEHGQKIEKAAEKANISANQFCDAVSKKFQNLSYDFNLTNNDFIRTTEERHKKGVAKFWDKLAENGFIYKGVYKGWYAIRDEAFYTEAELINGKAPTGAEVIWQEEESYFFKLSSFTKPLSIIYEKLPFMVFPTSRFNEVKAFISLQLNDLSISRSNFKWGIPVPSNKNHVIYVWLDALTNYITALGYGSENDSLYQKFWNGKGKKIHIIGKDILRFHAIFWPAFLIAERFTLKQVEEEFEKILPEILNFFEDFCVVSHGWWKNNGEKMSKSLGNAINPYDLKEKYGEEKVRYFFLRDLPFGGDGDFSDKRFIEITNADLANNIGNLTQRVLSFIYANCNGVIPKGSFKFLNSANLQTLVLEQTKNYKFEEAMLLIINAGKKANELIDKEAPWKLKKEEKYEEMNEVLHHLAFEIMNIFKALAFALPKASIKALKFFDGENIFPSYEEILQKSSQEQEKILFHLLQIELKINAKINKPEPIFIRL